MPRVILAQHRRHNFFQTVLLLLSMAALLTLAGYLLGHWAGVGVAIGILTLGILFSQPVSTKLLLRSYQARRLEPAQAPELIKLFHTICQRAGLEPLPLYYVPSRLPNAFAAGTGKQSLVAVSDGLLRIMTGRELAGVLAHEVAHVVNNDVRVLGLADAIARTTSVMSRVGVVIMLLSFSSNMQWISFGRYAAAGVVLFFAPLALILLQLAISRTREFDADLGAAEITSDPMGLAMALKKLESTQKKTIFQRIFAPGPKRSQPAMLRTHPETKQRVARLNAVAVETSESNPRSVEAVAGRRRVSAPQPRVRRRPRYHVTNGMWY